MIPRVFAYFNHYSHSPTIPAYPLDLYVVKRVRRRAPPPPESKSGI